MYDRKTIDVFLENQLKLFPEKVAENHDEAAEFLEDVCAIVLTKKDALKYFKEELDVYGMTDDEILSSEEVFDLGDGRYLIVEG